MDGTQGVVREIGLTMKAFFIFKAVDMIIVVVYMGVWISYALHRLHALMRQGTEMTAK
jgi:hypothetical protein